MKPIFISGIGTDVGKTIVSAVLVEKLKADYWKPIQSGDLENSDSDKVRKLVVNQVSKFHPEAYRFTQPFSPHKSAAIDGVEIDLESIKSPETNNKLIVEGAGGLMVPLNEQNLIIDLMEKLQPEVILVVRNYLGSINHTLLSIEVLKHKNLHLSGIIFSGDPDDSSESFIETYSRLKVLGRVPHLKELTPQTIQEAGKLIDFV